MNFEAIPTLKIEVEHMKHTIINHIGAMGSDLGKALETEIQRAIDNYDWQGQVTRIVHEALKDAIDGYFRYGKGNKMILAALNEGFDAVLGKD